MGKRKRKVILIFGAVLIVFALLIAAFEYIISHGKLTPLIEEKIKEETGYDVKIGSIFFDLLSGFTLNDTNCTIDPGLSVHVKTVRVRYKITEIIKGHIREIKITNPNVRLNVNKSTIFATDSLESSQDDESSYDIKSLFPSMLQIDDFRIDNIALQVESENEKTQLTGINTRFQNVQTENPIKVLINGNISFTGNGSVPIKGKLNIESEFDSADEKVLISENSGFTLPGMGTFSLNGTIDALTSKNGPKLNLKLKSEGFVLDKIVELLTSLDSADLSDLTLEGKSQISMFITGNMEKMHLSADINISKLKVAYDYIDCLFESFHLPFNAEIDLLTPALRITAKGSNAVLNNSQIWMDGEQIADLSIIPFSISLDYPEKANISMDYIDGNILIDENPISLKETFSMINIETGLRDLAQMPFSFLCDTSFSDPVNCTGFYNYNTDVISNIKFSMDSIRGADLAVIAKPLMDPQYKEWSFGGNISLNTTIDSFNSSDQENINIETDINIAHVEFSSPDYDYFGEGISGKYNFKVTSDNEFNPISFKTHGDLEPFLIGLNAFTTDMDNRKTTVSFDGNVDIKNDIISDLNAIIYWKDMGSFAIKGDIKDLSTNPDISLNLNMTELSNADIFKTFLKDSVEYTSPALFNTTITGKSNAELFVKGTKESLRIKGNFRVNNCDVQFGNTTVKDFNMEFPVSITYPTYKQEQDPQTKEDLKDAIIRIKETTYDFITINDLKMDAKLRNNSFSLKKPVIIPLFGGSFNINKLFVQDILNYDKNCILSFQLKNINLKEVSEAAGITPFEGNVETSEITFRQEGDSLFTDGEVRFSTFGGEIIINDLRVTGLMTPLMGIGFSAEVHHLNLGMMSSTFKEWGSVGGILEGKINNFKFVAGEPSNFDIELKTVKTNGIKQVISANILKSFVPGVGGVLDNLGFTRYNYKVIGFNAKLANDYITFRGAIKDDGKEFFMKGAGLKKIDIVFSNIDKKIKFSRFIKSFESMMSSDFDETKAEIGP